MYRHVNPEKLERTALAPYNFVPLPREIYEQLDPRALDAALTEHNRYANDLASGWIDLEIETLTPVFVRAPVVQDKDGRWDRRDARLRPDSAATVDGRPMLPGSSLRGMTRTLVEIMAFARLSSVTDAHPFFRTVADDRIGRRYRTLLVRGEQAPPGGFAYRGGDGQWEIRPAREVLRVEQGHISGLRYRQHPSYKPDWGLQHHPCWFTREVRRDRVAKLTLGDARPIGDGWEEGVLVLTGSSPNKKREFVFVRGSGATVAIPEVILDHFHDGDQISQWQEGAFPRDQPEARVRRAAGHLRDGEPVFYVCDESTRTDDNPRGLLFFGRAGMFRFPYDRSPKGLVPSQLVRTSESKSDLAELLFGRVSSDPEDGPTIRGRVRFEDAVATGAAPGGNWFEAPMVPRVLSSPKVTAFQHYLTQDGTAHPRDLTTYIEGDRTTLRGHKVYWHRWGDNGLSQARHPDQAAKLRDLAGPTPTDTQSTVIHPVKTGVRFAGRVRFDNLSEVELGALLAALRLPEGHAHRIGMAKPLGLGSVRISTTLHRIDRAQRYASWSSDGASKDDGTGCLRAFAEAIVVHARNSGEAMIEGREGLESIARIDALYTLLDWAHRPRLDDTRSMLIEKGDASRFRADNSGKVNEFKHRPVLPTPHHVARKPEPAWPGDRPSTAEAMERPESPRLPTRLRASTSAARTAVSSGAPTKPASATIAGLDLEVPGTVGQPGDGGRPSIFELTRHPGQVALVTFNKSDRSLRAVIDGIGDAFPRPSAADALFARLPDGVQRDLKKGRPVRLLVTWEVESNIKWIVDLAADPASSPL